MEIERKHSLYVLGSLGCKSHAKELGAVARRIDDITFKRRQIWSHCARAACAHPTYRPLLVADSEVCDGAPV